MGIYNSVDIDNALELGYKIKLVEGYYWEKTENVFDNYINYLYDFKKSAKKGSAQYTLVKLMMNGLYGKTIQRPILDENVIIRLHEEFIKLHIKFGGVTMRALSDGSFYLTYQDDTSPVSMSMHSVEGPLKKKGRDLTARYIWFKKLACIVCGCKVGKTSSISTKFSRSHLEARKSVMLYASNSFACSRQTSDYGSERALNLEASGGKSDEISNYRFSGGRWAKPSNRDIFGGVV